jgi:hypothetical protein
MCAYSRISQSDTFNKSLVDAGAFFLLGGEARGRLPELLWSGASLDEFRLVRRFPSVEHASACSSDVLPLKPETNPRGKQARYAIVRARVCAPN